MQPHSITLVIENNSKEKIIYPVYDKYALHAFDFPDVKVILQQGKYADFKASLDKWEYHLDGLTIHCIDGYNGQTKCQLQFGYCSKNSEMLELKMEDGQNNMQAVMSQSDHVDFKYVWTEESHIYVEMLPKERITLKFNQVKQIDPKNPIHEPVKPSKCPTCYRPHFGQF